MVMISYNEAMDEEILELLEGCAARNFTKLIGVYGRGRSSGTHMGSDIWPGLNHLLYVACDEKQTQALLAGVRKLRQKLGHEGVKAFVLPIEEMTSE